MLSLLTTRILVNLAKWSKPKPKVQKLREEKKSFALGDQKAAKLSKSEQQQENKQKMLEQQKLQAQTKRQIGIYKTHHKSLEQFISPRQLENVRVNQLYYLKGIKTQKRKIAAVKPLTQQNSRYLMTDTTYTDKNDVRKTKRPIYGNYTELINKPLKNQLKQFEGNQNMRRMGTLGVKLGMTTLWDKWGSLVPVTVIQLDRCQVVQIKQPTHQNQYYQVQMGIGQSNFKRINKSRLGHFVKSGVPPKRVLSEFTVSKECLLPIGYMMTVRHYTPGMFIDVVGKTVGHGFQGTIKKYGFRRQPETHGNSTTTRVLGSTGCRQDPGRVFKQKKMYGQMGNKITVQTGLTVFKIDVDKNLLYLKGSVPGKPGSIIKIRDTLSLDKIQKNLQLVHYPTFVEEPGVAYARQMSMYCGQRDPQQMEIHDNAFILDEDEEEVVAATPTDKDAQLQ